MKQRRTFVPSYKRRRRQRERASFLAALNARTLSPRHSMSDSEGDVCVSAHHEADCAPADTPATPCELGRVCVRTGGAPELARVLPALRGAD